ncbi:MAG: RNA polymerase sigma-70 factor [Bacteroidales bacterium]|nr:RNA polymerase sigma-70 factor [Bacteroidales bacterium]
MEKQVSVNDLQAGSHEAYEVLFTRWYTPLCDYAYGIVYSADEAEDIVQKMFCKLWDQRDRIEIRTSIKSYLYRVVHNDCINRVKQLKNMDEHHRYLGFDFQNGFENASDQLEYNELKQKIETAIENLPPRCREVFELSRYSCLSYAEIAEKMGISSGTVEKQISKALQVLRKELGDYLLFLTILIIL